MGARWLVYVCFVLTDANPSMSFAGKHFNVITVEDPPFVSIRENPFNKSSAMLPTDQWYGYIVDLLRETSERGNFTFNLSVPEVTFNYGEAYKHLAQGEVDMCFSAAYINKDRLNNNFMTGGFQTAPLSLLVKRTAEDEIYNAQSFGDFVGRPFQPVGCTVGQ